MMSSEVKEMPKVNITCVVCGADFLVKPYRKETAKCCSGSCRGKYVGSLPQVNRKGIPRPYARGNKWRKGLKPTNAFESGHKPWNKNLKGIHLSPKSEFQKGRASETKMPIGSVTIRKDKNGSDRAFVKVADPNVWKFRARLVWENHHGPIPKGKVIHHIDRDSLNDDISNLACLTRSEHINEHRNDLVS